MCCAQASAVNAANDVTSAYGVTILSINIISAVPADAALQNALAKGAVASAEAEQAETVARGRARAARILAEGTPTGLRTPHVGMYTPTQLLANKPCCSQVTQMQMSYAPKDRRRRYVTQTTGHIHAQSHLHTHAQMG